MPSLLRACRRLAFCACLAAAPLLVSAQVNYGPQGSEYRVLGSLPLAGDQVHSDIALNASKGYLVWQDNATDASGLGISAQRIDQTLTGSYSPFQVNQVEAGDQESPKVAMLPDGGAVFVWLSKGTNISARIVNSRGFLGSEIVVSADSANTKNSPDVEVLTDGTIVVVWATDAQDGSMQGIYSQRLDRTGAKLGAEMRVNSITALNQRTPAILALDTGGYVVSWVHEAGSIAAGFSIDVFARAFNATGVAASAEFKVNTDAAVCANPAMARAADGSFVVAWSQKAKQITSHRVRGLGSEIGQEVQSKAQRDVNSWDVFARGFTAAAAPKQLAAACINSYRRGPQYGPRLATLGSQLIVVWTTVAQDGDLDGVFGRFVDTNLAFSGEDFQVNERYRSMQIHPAVASSADNRFLVVWSGFLGGTASFELSARRFQQTSLPLEAPSAPFVTALTQTRLSVTWRPLAGLDVEKYIVLVDDRAPVETSTTSYMITGLAPASTHSVALKYKLADGRTSPASSSVSATTWGEDLNDDGLPDDWQQTFWAGVTDLPTGGADSDGDGASNVQELLAGTDPRSAASVLRVTLTRMAQGVRLSWNTVEGSVYQVQTSSDLRAWTNVGAATFANASSASALIGQNSNRHNYYRVIRIRQ